MSDLGTVSPVVAILPARGGSKRIPRKNIRPFLGEPLIAKTVKGLLKADIFDHIFVSTDDDEIAAVAERAGAEVPFRRPGALADDHTGTEAVIRHAIRCIEEQTGELLAFVCAVYPAAVFTRATDLAGAMRLLDDTVDFVFSASSFPHPIQRAMRRLPDGYCEILNPQHLSTRSQDLEPTYHDAGQFYWGRRTAWMAGVPVFLARSKMYLLPRKRVQDIDTPEDWERAEMLYRLLVASGD